MYAISWYNNCFISSNESLINDRGVSYLREFDTRTLKDRRKYPTPVISRFTLWGRRQTFRRKEDQERGGYVDRYHSGLLILFTLAVGLTVLDALFTIMILDDGGWEINPVVRSVIQLYGDRFWVWKFVIVSFSLTLLCLHSKFRLVMPVILGITAISIIVILYQIFLYIY
jgi:hypothetical protein